MITQLCYAIKWRINKWYVRNIQIVNIAKKDYHCPYNHMCDGSP